MTNPLLTLIQQSRDLLHYGPTPLLGCLNTLVRPGGNSCPPSLVRQSQGVACDLGRSPWRSLSLRVLKFFRWIFSFIPTYLINLDFWYSLFPLTGPDGTPWDMPPLFSFKVNRWWHSDRCSMIVVWELWITILMMSCHYYFDGAIPDNVAPIQWWIRGPYGLLSFDHWIFVYSSSNLWRRCPYIY